MPIYQYGCANGHVSDALRKVDERKDPFPCPQCGEPTTHEVTVVAFDNLRMGVDSGFPTAYDRWAKMQTQKNSER